VNAINQTDYDLRALRKDPAGLLAFILAFEQDLENVARQMAVREATRVDEWPAIVEIRDVVRRSYEDFGEARREGVLALSPSAIGRAQQTSMQTFQLFTHLRAAVLR
jgi:hypothetical protein